MHFFDEKTAVDLEFDQIRELLVKQAKTATVASRLSKLQPLRSSKTVEYKLGLVHELQLIRNRGLNFPRMEFEELKKDLQLLNVKASVLDESGIIRILDANRFVNALFLFFKAQDHEYELLKSLLKEAHYTKAIEKEIEKIFDKRLKIKDDASEQLYSIRQNMDRVKRQINRNFDKALRSAKKDGYVDDLQEDFIDNRRVLTVVSTYKRQVDGQILGTSKTGSLTYIEPQVNRALNFELDQLIDDERKEIRKILANLTDFLREHLLLIESYQKIICDFDEINAKEKLARALNGLKPQINFENQDCFLKEAYHPLLFLKNQESKLKTVPQTFSLNAENRLLVISGPNAGGKSITLKTMGLLQLMFQSALLVPVSSKSKMAFFDFVLSDIGDNQSIENQLSTYSYRLQRMNFFLKKLGPKTLLLLDEFGTGSDPELGGALAEVFFETIYDEKCFGVVTTHYSNIKLKAAELAEAVNANMIFNRRTLSPEYQLAIGQPGSSFTFEVAEMNGIPKSMLSKAKSKVDRKKLKFDQLISDLQKDKSILKKLKNESYNAKLEMEESQRTFEAKSEHYEERLERQQKMIERNNKYLNHGKRMAQFIQNYPSKSKAKQNDLLKEVKKYITIEKSKIDAAIKKEQEAQKLKEAQSKAQKNKKRKRISQKVEKPLTVGVRAKIKNTKQVGEVLSINGKEATIAFGNLKAKVKIDSLVVI